MCEHQTKKSLKKGQSSADEFEQKSSTKLLKAKLRLAKFIISSNKIISMGLSMV
jgi:hypothetical protein